MKPQSYPSIAFIQQKSRPSITSIKPKAYPFITSIENISAFPFVRYKILNKVWKHCLIKKYEKGNVSNDCPCSIIIKLIIWKLKTSRTKLGYYFYICNWIQIFQKSLYLDSKKMRCIKWNSYCIYIQYCALYTVHHWEYILFVNIVLIHRGTSYNMFGNHALERKKTSVWKRITI